MFLLLKKYNFRRWMVIASLVMTTLFFGLSLKAIEVEGYLLPESDGSELVAQTDTQEPDEEERRSLNEELKDMERQLEEILRRHQQDTESGEVGPAEQETAEDREEETREEIISTEELMSELVAEGQISEEYKKELIQRLSSKELEEDSLRQAVRAVSLTAGPAEKRLEELLSSGDLGLGRYKREPGSYLDFDHLADREVFIEDPSESDPSKVVKRWRIETVELKTDEDGLPTDYVFTGTGEPEKVLFLFVYSSPTGISVLVEADGSWELELDKNLADGWHRAYLLDLTDSGELVARSEEFGFYQSEGEIKSMKEAVKEEERQSLLWSWPMAGLAVSVCLILIGLIIIFIGVNPIRRRH